MWKEMLLQAFVSITPVFLYSAWVKRFGLRRSSVFFGLSFGLSMVLCFLLSFDIYEGFTIDFRFLPYLLGSLYGGYPALIVLSGLYVGLKIPTLHDFGEWVRISAFMLIFVPLLLLSIRPFRKATRKGKRKISYILLACVVLLIVLVVMEYAYRNHLDFKDICIMLSVFFLLVVMNGMTLHTIENITESYQMQLQLNRMSRKYRNEVYKLQQFIDETSIGVVIIDNEGRITHLNDIVISMVTSLSSGRRNKLEYLGKPYEVLFGNEDHCEYNARIMKAFTGFNTISELIEANNKKLLESVFSIRDAASGSIVGVAILFQDFTELMRLRDEVGQMERLSLVGQMAASITHEIRNPMAVIRGFVQLMKERSPDTQQEYFHIVIDELDRANAIISDFLSLAQNRIIAKESISLQITALRNRLRQANCGEPSTRSLCPCGLWRVAGWGKARSVALRPLRHGAARRATSPASRVRS